MAIVWGPTINDRWAVGIEITQTASTDSTVTLRAEYFFWARYNISDSNNSFSASGSFGSTSGSRPVSTSTSGGTVSLGSQTMEFARAYGSALTASQSIRFSGLEAVGATLTASASYSIPRRSYSAPPAPVITSQSFSGTTGIIGWVNHHSADATSGAYASHLVANWYYMGADEASVYLGTHTPSNTAYADSYTIPAGRAFTVGLYATNPDNSSATVWTGWVYPTPAAPTGISNTRNSDSQNTVRWTPQAPNLPDTNIIIERSMNGGSFVHLATLAATASSHTDTTTAAGNSYSYRVLTKYGDKYSSWTTSGTTYNTPAVPSLTDVVRNSDTQYTISLKTNAPNRTGTYTLIERQANDDAWTQIASVSPTATSYIDSGTTANYVYRYRARTVYGNAYSGYSTSGVYYNTPAKPSNVKAAKNADNSVTVSWNDNARTESGHSLQRSQDGGATWVTVTSDIAANATSYTDLAAPGGSLVYRVEAHRHPLYSGWSAPSPSITTIAPPKAPTITDYPRATVSTEAGGFTIGWLHNPVDGSAQTAAEIAILPPDSTETFISITGTASTYRVDTTATGAHRISVRTKGSHADWSPWASHIYVTLADSPTVTISEPSVDGAVIDAIPATTAWTMTDPAYSIIEHTYTITDSQGRVTYMERNPEGGAVALDASTWIPSNGETYTLTVSARSGSGLTGSASRIFSVAYVPPVEPTIGMTNDDERLAVQLQLTDGAPEDGRAMPETYTVIRITDEGETVLATGLVSGGVVDDPIPPLNVPYTYKIISHAASGAIATSVVEAYLAAQGRYMWNYANAYTWISASTRVGEPISTLGELYRFPGNEYPEWYGINGIEHEPTVTGIVRSRSQEEALRALGEYHHAAIYRDPYGRRYRVKAKRVTIDTGAGAYRADVSVEMVRLSWLNQ